jgi:hypothetical protein
VLFQDFDSRGTEQYSSSDLPARNLALFLDQRHRVVMNRVRHLVTQRAGDLSVFLTKYSSESTT